MSARRRLNARSTGGGTPAISAMPLRTGVHSTPSSRVSDAAQPRLVEVAGGLGVRVDAPGVERRPPAVGAEREVGDEHVGVQLRVAGARGPMPERGGDEPVAGDRVHAGRPAARHRRLALHVAERVGDRLVVRRLERRRAGGRRRSPNSTLTHFGAENVRSNPGRRAGEHPAERLAGRRMLAGEHAVQRLARRPSPRSPSAAAPAPIHAPVGLRSAEVVVLDARATDCARVSEPWAWSR